MKRMMMVLPLAAMMMITGCADKFLSARVAISAGRAALNMAQMGIDAADKAKQQSCSVPICQKVDPTGGVQYQACLGQDHSADAAWQTCYAKFKKFKTETWPQSERTATAGFNAAEASVNLAEARKAGLPVDVVPLLKASACLVAQSLEFLEAKIREKIQIFLDMMKAFGCSPTP